MADLEDSLKKLDRLTQEEARMALSEVLKITHNTRDEVKVVDSKVEIVGKQARGEANEIKLIVQQTATVIAEVKQELKCS